ncbi:hypothetical protein [Roseibium litorale]|uniref:HEAT repeat domain-containing protein n=1 Tax=Roseibium litorale TaxID=2803841 RepID=A0ABR9CSU9_9HYPH|nr:hypothetical protein [Roseibium litorale]MBD8893351.1 hypothetical protein [Roseibium litorale]
MNDFSHVVGRRGTEHGALKVAADLSPMRDPQSCGVDCYIQQQQSTRRRWCFCDVLASIQAHLEDRADDEFRVVFHPDPAVRLSFAHRLSEGDLAPFLDDPDSEVRELAYGRLLAVSRQQVSRLMTAP